MQWLVRLYKGRDGHGSVRGIIGLTLLFTLMLLLTLGCGGTKETPAPGSSEGEITHESVDKPEANGNQGSGVQDVEEVSEEAPSIEVPEKEETDVTGETQATQEGSARENGGQGESAPGGEIEGTIGQEKAVRESDQQEMPVTEAGESQTAHQLVLEQGGLLITGTGLTKDLALNPSQWQLNSPDFVQRFYSSNNNLGFHKVWRVKGYDLLSLFRQAGMVEGKDHTITFVSADGLSISFPLSDLQNRFFFSDLTPASGVKAMPVIGFYRKELFDAIEPQPPVSWQEEALSDGDADPQWPRLYLGQQPNNPSDVNQPFFIRELVRIVVGEER